MVKRNVRQNHTVTVIRALNRVEALRTNQRAQIVAALNFVDTAESRVSLAEFARTVRKIDFDVAVAPEQFIGARVAVNFV